MGGKIKLGGIIGRALGSIGSAILPFKGIDGGTVGQTIGDMAGFKHGGKVNRTGKALVHKGEYVLPANAKPTKAQKAVVAKNKAKGKKGKK